MIKNRSNVLMTIANCCVNTENIDLKDFKLSDEFLSKYRDQKPLWKNPLSEFVFLRTYARVQNGKKETFFDAIKRIVEGTFTILKSHYIENSPDKWNQKEMQKKAQIFFEKIWSFKMLPPGRGLWMMGTDFIHEKGSIALNSCGFCSTKEIATEGAKPFAWCMDALMLGVGIGSDTRGEGTIRIKKPTNTNDIHIIPDSREGWVESVQITIDSYFFGRELPQFDFSRIRKAGEKINGFGGTASGPQPLIDLLKNIRLILNERIEQKITSEDIVDIFTNIAKCVIAGNVRRSAEIMLGDIDDKNFLNLKNGNKDLPAYRNARWATNNSVICSEKRDDYLDIAKNIRINGEPGIFWINNARAYSRFQKDELDWRDKDIAGCNPCSEQSLQNYELCNLVETFPSHHDSLEEYLTTLEMAYLYAKTVTLLPIQGVSSLWDETQKIIDKNRRIGISQSGIIEAFSKHGKKTMQKWCDVGYNFLKNLDQKMSALLQVNPSIKLTTVKPSGTVSLVAGVTPGIHYPHASHYLRRVRIGKTSQMYEYLKEQGVTLIPDVQYWKKYPSKHHKAGQYIFNKQNEPMIENKELVETFVVEFPMKTEFDMKTKFDVSIEEQLENVREYQKYWSDNQISVTITFDKDKYSAKDLNRILCEAQHHLKSVSFLPISHHGYHLAPYEAISREEFEQRKTEFNLDSYKGNSVGEKWCNNDTCIF